MLEQKKKTKKENKKRKQKRGRKISWRLISIDKVAKNITIGPKIYIRRVAM